MLPLLPVGLWLFDHEAI